MTATTSAIRLVLAALLIASADWCKSHIEEGAAARTLGLPVVVPPPAVVRAATLGYTGFGADVYWLKFLEYFGDKRYRAVKFDALVPLMDLVTALDPKLCIVYRQAGLLLTSSEITDLAAARRLLYAGLAACPDDSYIPFVLGFNLYYFDHRFKEAGDMLERAAKMPGSPEWLGDLAVRVRSKEMDLPALETMLSVMLEAEQEERARAAIERRLKYVRTEMLLRKLDALGFVPPDAKDPSGGTLSIDNGRAKSSAYELRLELKDDALK